jgi:hypothetical protein
LARAEIKKCPAALIRIVLTGPLGRTVIELSSYFSLGLSSKHKFITCTEGRPLLSNESILAPNPSNAFNEAVASFLAAKCKGVCPSPVDRESMSAPR